jgi:hypothetical protein
MAGELLQQDLRRMDAAYLEQNKREYEITKHVSLAEVQPVELMKLRGGGKCIVNLEEVLFEQDWPGHYLRRIKSVSVTVPVTNAPYGSVNCKLKLTSSEVKPTAAAAQLQTDHRPIQSIITSTGQQDSGLYELVFRDERYLPFEGAGAISDWEITLKKEGNRFDPATIHDFVMHVRYMARELENNSASAPPGVSGYRLFSAKTEFPAEWHAFVEGVGAPAVHELQLPLALRHFQPLVGKEASAINKIHLFALRIDRVAQAVDIAVEASDGRVIAVPPLAPDLPDTPVYGKIVYAQSATISQGVAIQKEPPNGVTPWTLTTTTSADALDDIWLICEYSGT